LAGRLAKLGADLLIETLPAYLRGALTPEPQDEALATYSPEIPKSAGEMDFTRTADELARQVRAYEPWPASFLTWKGRRLVVHRARAHNPDRNAPGQVRAVDGYPAVMTSAGLLILEIVQPEGKRSMDGADFVRGAPGFVGSLLTVPGKA
jgi:methionyl-tRNA formyltransferase